MLSDFKCRWDCWSFIVFQRKIWHGVSQAQSFAVGFIVMIIQAQIPPKVYQAISPYFFIFAVILMVLVWWWAKPAWEPDVGLVYRVLVVCSLLSLWSLPCLWWWRGTLQAAHSPPKFMHIVIFCWHYDVAVFIGSFATWLKPRSLWSQGVCHFPQWYFLWLIALACGALVVVALLWMFFLVRVPKKRVLTLFDPESDALGAVGILSNPRLPLVQVV